MADQSAVDREVQELRRDIVRTGTRDAAGEWSVKYGVLFDDPKVEQYYEALLGTLKAAKREQGRTLTEEERAVVKGRKAAKARLAQLLELRPPPPLSSAVPMPPPPAAAAASASADAGAAPPPSAPFDLAEQYIALVEKHPPPGGADALLSHSIFHLRRLCRTPLAEFDLLAALKACASLAECADVIGRCRAYTEGARPFEGRRRPPSYWKRQQRRGKVK